MGCYGLALVGGVARRVIGAPSQGTVQVISGAWLESLVRVL
jgi:hypothetical protein